MKTSFWGLLGLIPGNLIFLRTKFFETYNMCPLRINVKQGQEKRKNRGIISLGKSKIMILINRLC